MSLIRAALAALVLTATLAVSSPGGAQVAADPTGDPVGDPGSRVASDLPFPGVPGVDPDELGYEGPELGDALRSPVDLESLPDDVFARAQAVGVTVETLSAERDGLAELGELLEGVISDLNPRIGHQRRAAALARVHLDQARRRVRTLEHRIRSERAEMQSHERRMVDAAIAAYIRPPDADTIGKVLDTGATSSAELAAPVLHEAKFEHDLEVKDHQEVTVATLHGQLGTLVDDQRTLERRRREDQQELETLVERRTAHVEALRRTNDALAEVDARLEVYRGVLEEVLVAYAFSDESIVSSSQASDAGVPVVVVQGIRIHAALAARLEALLTAAREDGIVLRGWGHRSHESQIALRRAHCGPEPEDIWLKPPSQCAPPTAIPGRSMHEVGMAVDFTHDGAAIASRESPAYQWLAEHAAEYGFFNLPSEPWHWSVNGR